MTWTPSGLGERGLSLWNEITSTYQLRADEKATLADACREADIIEKLQAEFATRPLITTGSMGQDVAAPHVSEIRQHRITLKTLLAQLKLPDTPDVAARKRATVSENARKAARTRWGTGAGTG